MKSFKKTVLGSSLALVLILSGAQQANAAEAAVTTWDIKTKAKIITGLAIATAVAPIITHYYIRKPLAEPRFDMEKIKTGTWEERAQHSWYFFIDSIIGWPYKDGKTKYKNVNGSISSYIEAAQKPGGLLGYFDAYVLLGWKKALEKPIQTVAGLMAMGYLVNRYMNLDFMPHFEVKLKI